MGNPEISYIHHIDDSRRPPTPEVGDQGKNAEGVVLDFFSEKIPRMKMRRATPEEDSGFGKAIDAVGYLDNKPALGLQITTATDSVARQKKLGELQDRPFLRLSEMNPQKDPAIPRAIAFLEAQEVAGYLNDRDFSKHPGLMKQILESTVSSLRFDLTQTKNPQEIERLQGLIQFLETERQNIEGRATTGVH